MDVKESPYVSSWGCAVRLITQNLLPILLRGSIVLCFCPSTPSYRMFWAGLLFLIRTPFCEMIVSEPGFVHHEAKTYLFWAILVNIIDLSPLLSVVTLFGNTSPSADTTYHKINSTLSLYNSIPNNIINSSLTTSIGSSSPHSRPIGRFHTGGGRK